MMTCDVWVGEHNWRYIHAMYSSGLWQCTICKTIAVGRTRTQDEIREGGNTEVLSHEVPHHD